MLVPTSYVLSIVVAVLVVIGGRLLLPLPARRSGAGWVDAALVLLGGLGLTFHCTAMFYRSTVDGLPGVRGLVDAVNRLGPASVVAYAVPAVVLLVGLRRARPALLVLVVAGLTAVGITMYDDGPLDTHLTAIVVAVALIALATADLFAPDRGGGDASARTTQTAT